MKLFKKHFLLLLFTFIGLSTAYSQNNDLKKANILYRAKSYAEAIPLYEKGLEEKNSTSARAKLAYCYKMLNKLDLAERQYALVVNEKFVRPDALYYYGEVLMSKARYDEAKTWFLKYHELEPDKSEGRGLRMAEACDQVAFIEPLFAEASVTPFPFNSENDDSSPVYYSDGMVFSSDRNPGIKLLKQKSGTTGNDFINMYFSKLDEQLQWTQPKPFSSKLNEHNKNNANASFSPDGEQVYFTRNNSVSNRKNAYTLQVYGAVMGKKGKWRNVEIQSFCRDNHNYMHPAISPDGRTIFFVSDKPGGLGGTDLYYSQRNGDEWGPAINLDSIVNTSAHEGFPFMSYDGKLYFCSKGHFGYGGYDIFVTQQNDDGSWAKPVNVGKPINSPLDDISIYLTPNNAKGAFTSSRDGGDDDIYLFSLVGGLPVAEPVAATDEETENTTSAPDEFIEEVTNDTEEVITQDENVVSAEPGPSTPVETPPTTEPIAISEKPETTDASPTELEIEAPTDLFVDNSHPTSDPEPNSVATTENSDDPTHMYDNDNTPVEEEEILTAPIPTIPEINTEPVDETIEKTSDVINQPEEIPTEEPSSSNQPDNEFINMEEPEPDNNETTIIETPSEMEPESTPSDPVATDEKQDPWEQVLEPIEDGSDPEIAPTEHINVAPSNTTSTPVDKTAGQLLTFKNFRQAVSKGNSEPGMYFILEDLKYFPGQYMLRPKMTLLLNPLVKLMEQHADLTVEIGAHTESIGYDQNNLAVSKKRAKAIKNYLVYKGIAAERINEVGFGETQLVNHCSNGVVCTEEEHMANQRVEVWLK